MFKTKLYIKYKKIHKSGSYKTVWLPLQSSLTQQIKNGGYIKPQIGKLNKNLEFHILYLKFAIDKIKIGQGLL